MRELILLSILLLTGMMVNAQTPPAETKSSDPVPQTSVHIESTYDHLDIDHHKNIFLKCSGGPDEQHTYTSDGGKHDSTANKGTLNTVAGAYGSWYTGHTVTWNSTYSNQDFDIDFNYNIAKPTTINQGTECDDNEHLVKVKTADGNIVSKIVLTIPESVWFVEVNATEISGTEATAHAEITGNTVLKRFSSDDDTKVGQFSQGKSVFFTTRPNDQITITVDFNAGGLVMTRDLHARFHVGFIGQDQCEKIRDNFGTFSADVTETALSTLQGQHSGIIYGLGCLTRDDFSQKILENNNSKQITSLINSLQLMGLSSDSTILKDNEATPLRTVSEFAYYHLAFMAMKDILPFCQETTIKDLYTQKDGIKTDTFVANNYFLMRIIHRLRGFQIERFYAFVDGINKLSKGFPTYKAIMADPVRAGKIKQAYEALRVSADPNPGTLSLDLLPYSSTLSLFKKLKLTTTDSVAYQEMYSTLVELAALQPQFTEKFSNLITGLTSLADTKIDTGAFKELITTLEKKNSHLLDFFDDKAQWFSTASLTNSFITDLTQFHIQLARFSGETLEQY